jgi:hypothetical protein
MRKCLILFLFFCSAVLRAQQDNPLRISSSDTRLIRNDDGSFELYVRKVAGRESILLTDSTADSSQMADSYTLRAYQNHPSYGRRILNGVYIDNEERRRRNLEPLYFLTDSSAEVVPRFGTDSEWFHIHLPRAVIFGYPWSIEGQFDFEEGTWFNIRAFALKDTDYGSRRLNTDYRDNPFLLRTRSEKPPLNVREIPFDAMSSQTNGKFFRPKDSEEMVRMASAIIQHHRSDSVDIAFVIDTTISMKQHMDYVKKELLPQMYRQMHEVYPNRKLRFGIVLYRDYPPDQYLTRVTPLSDDMAVIERTIEDVVVGGGGDIPEAVYEGVYAALTELDWQGTERIIIQIGDAPPHRTPVKDIDEALVLATAKEKNAVIYTIFLPDSRQGQGQQN